jgi:hypothetical protein
MKSILPSIFMLLFSGSLLAQCVPHAGFSGSGIAFYPAQLDPIFTCVGCGDQEVVISLQTFADTTLSVELSPGNPPLDVTVFADFFRLDSIAGLPAGLSYTTDAAFDTTYDVVLNPFGYWINPGDTTNGFTPTPGCITISGAEADWNAAVNGGPNSDGLYPLTIFIDARAANFEPTAIGGIVGFNTWLTEMGVLLDAFGDPNFTPNGIKFEGKTLNVRPSGVGINELNSGEFSMVENRPNPFSNNTTIAFEMAAAGQQVEFTVYNLLGNLIHSQSVSAMKGLNTIEFFANGLSSGIYLYTISNAETTVTRKMVIE